MDRRLLRDLRRQGWKVTKGRKHWKAVPPDVTQRIVMIPCTSGDTFHGPHNMLAELKRSGFRENG